MLFGACINISLRANVLEALPVDGQLPDFTVEVQQLEHGLWRENALAVVALEEDDVVPHVVGEVVALPLLVDDE